MENQSRFLYLPSSTPYIFGKKLRELTTEAFGLSAQSEAVGTLYNLYSKKAQSGGEISLPKGIKEAPKGIDKRNLRSWFRGELDDPRGKFTTKHFRFFISLFWEYEAISEVEEIHDLARCAGPKFVSEAIYADWVWKIAGEKSFTQTLPLPSDLRYPPLKQFIKRPKSIDEINEKKRFCLDKKIPLVIYGQPGTGKTTLIQYLEKEMQRDYSELSLKKDFPDLVLSAFLNGGSYEPFLDVWHQKLVSDHISGYKYPLQKLIGEIKRKLVQKKTLLLIDDVSEADYAHALMLEESSDSLTIITTSNPYVVKQLAKNRGSIINIDGLLDEEALSFFTSLTGTESIDKNGLKKLNKILHGNPLALQGAFSLLDYFENDWFRLISNLEDKQTPYPDQIANSVFLVQKIVYEKMLSSELQKRFRALGSVDPFWRYEEQFFQSLWECSKDDAKTSLEQLQYYGRLVERDEGDLWDIHKSTLVTAKSILKDDQYMNEQEVATQRLEKWQKRVEQTLHEDLDLDIVSLSKALISSPKKELRKNISLFTEDDAKKYLSGEFTPLVVKNSRILTPLEAIKGDFLNKKRMRSRKNLEIFLISYSLITLAFLAFHILYRTGRLANLPYWVFFGTLFFPIATICAAMLLTSFYRYSATLRKLTQDVFLGKPEKGAER